MLRLFMDWEYSEFLSSFDSNLFILQGEQNESKWNNETPVVL